MRCTLDPFHDLPINAGGRPDGCVRQSVTKVTQKQVKIKAPPGNSGIWEFCVNTSPVSFPEQGNGDVVGMWIGGQYDDNGHVTQEPSLAVTTQGGGIGVVNVVAAPDGATCFTHDGNFNPVTAELSSIALGSAATGKSRIVGMGIELTNTTPELYKGGSLTACRTDGQSEQIYTRRDDFSADHTHPYQNTPGVPRSAEEVYRTPGAKQWNASYGAYTVCTYTTENDKMHAPVAANVLQTTTNDTSTNAGTERFTLYGDNTDITKKTCLDHSVILVEGLDPNATFTLTTRIYSEYVPVHPNSDVDFLKKASPFDPKALELVSALRMELPPAVHVGDNDGGDWFRAVSTMIRVAIPAVFPSTRPVFIAAAPLLQRGTERIAAKLDKAAVQRKKKKGNKKK